MAMTGSDPTLLAVVEEELAPRHPVVAVATTQSGRIAVASRGASTGSAFEIGSISKGLTALLYADALDRGVVEETSTLGELLPLDDAPAASVSLGALATHRSGLPTLPAAAQPLRRTLRLWTAGTNPYGETLDELLAQVRTVSVGRPRPRYSNLGFQLLGHAVAAESGTSYSQLLHDRVADPLGLASVHVPAAPSDLWATDVVGQSARGHAREAWTGGGLGPAGGVRASIGDMAVLARALLDGTATGTSALDPVAAFAGSRVQIGAAWLVMEHEGRSITWHNGATGGFTSWLGLDRAAGTGVVVLSGTGRSVDRAGFRLLSRLTAGTLG